MNQIMSFNPYLMNQGMMPGMASMNPFGGGMPMAFTGNGMSTSSAFMGEGVSYSPEMQMMQQMYQSQQMQQMQQMMQMMMTMMMMMMMKMMGGSMCPCSNGGMQGNGGNNGFPGMGFPGFPGNYPGNQQYDNRAGNTHNTGGGGNVGGSSTPSGNLVSISGEKVDSSIAPKLQAMIAAAKADGVNLDIISGYRSNEEQKQLYAKYGPGRAAKPGTSNHEKGMAVDFANTPGAYKWLAQHASEYGLKTNAQSGGWEQWHVSPTGR
ncbi:MAG: D-alanyl-D-alanine carboxypeptidase family protein [Candidatus Xenobiia bacterium LiM19]